MQVLYLNDNSLSTHQWSSCINNELINLVLTLFDKRYIHLYVLSVNVFII